MKATQLPEYFKTTTGTSVLSTADADGCVNSAVYARPRFFDDGRIAFIMLDHLSHANLQSNPHASYLFIAEGKGYEGVRLHLTKVAEERNTERVQQCLEDRGKGKFFNQTCFLVFFEIDKILPLVTKPS
ncbi:MAG: pyridoxamine 5'-phosphate oxidase [Desulfobacteraceae bacterium 4572_35.2]|nr:MAG: pyridoxamine 5'-phosphate oxidase [Desulfobacteraceae bacterium 4572_35.2]